MAPVWRLGPMHLPTIVERDRFAEVAGANQGQEALEQHLPQGQQFLEEPAFDRMGGSAVLSRPIEVREIDADTYLRAWAGDADPRQLTHQLSVLRSITARYSSHDFVGNANVLTWLLGRPPTTFAAFVRRQEGLAMLLLGHRVVVVGVLP